MFMPGAFFLTAVNKSNLWHDIEGPKYLLNNFIILSEEVKIIIDC